MIDAAAAGDHAERARFAERYGPVIRAALGSRRGRRLAVEETDDLVQETFLECFRAGGALGRVEAGRAGGFRGYLYGVVRNVALRAERRRAQAAARTADLECDALPADDPEAAVAFERAWAQGVMRAAAEEMDRRAEGRSAAAKRRVALLHLRFHEGLPIREIGKRWGVDAAKLHHEYADARREFAAALRAVVAAESGAGEAEVEAECARLLGLLG
jgi:RNA polymerase sigma factor (sigma-70 family)